MALDQNYFSKTDHQYYDMKNDDLLPRVIKTTFPLKYTANHNNTLGHNLFREICRMKQAPDCLRLELLFKHLGLRLAMITKKVEIYMLDQVWEEYIVYH